MSTAHIAQQLARAEVISFGTFTLKSGHTSPFYVDLRRTISSPDILRALAKQIRDLVRHAPIELVCGVPEAAVPLATAYSLTHGTPLILKRKHAKAHGMGKNIEGVYKEKQKVLLIEDTITTGRSLQESIQEIESFGLCVVKVIAIVDRAQGGLDYLRAQGYDAEAVLTIYDLLDACAQEKKINSDTHKEIVRFIINATEAKNNHTPRAIKKTLPPWSEKRTRVDNPVARQMLDYASEKNTRLVLACDITTTQEIYTLVRACAPHICVLKLHADIISDFTLDFATALQALACEHKFLIFEDRKFADIGQTEYAQFTGGVHRINEWADMVSVQVVAGEASLLSLVKSPIKNDKPIALVPIVQMSSAGNFMDASYTQKAMEITCRHSAHIAAVVAQDIAMPPHILKMTPGVHLEHKADERGQQYRSPQEILSTPHAPDFIIVGRGVTQSKNPAQSAIAYQRAWQV